MNKILRFFLILILVLLVGFLVLCMTSPSELKVERSTTMAAPKAAVWEQIVKFNNWSNWSPWKEQDTTIVVDITGVDGQPGSVYHYVGKTSGEGATTNTGVTDGEMKYEMNFIKPFKATADGYYRVVEEGGKTKVTWYFHQNHGFFMRGFAAIMGIEKMLIKSFDRGLELMKNYTETHKDMMPATATGMEITEIEFPAHIYAGVRGTIKWADMQKFFSDGYALVGKEAGARIAGPASALYYTWDEKNMQADMVACFPVADNKPVKGATIIEIPASAGYKMNYVGPYSGFENAHKAMNEKLASAGKQMKVVVEEYIKDPMSEKDSMKYETNIIYLVK